MVQSITVALELIRPAAANVLINEIDAMGADATPLHLKAAIVLRAHLAGEMGLVPTVTIPLDLVSEARCVAIQTRIDELPADRKASHHVAKAILRIAKRLRDLRGQ